MSASTPTASSGVLPPHPRRRTAPTAEIAALAARLRDLGVVGAVPAATDGGPAAVVTAMTAAVAAHLRDAAPDPTATAALAVVACDLQRLELDLVEGELGEQARRREGGERALGRLRPATGTAALLDRVCDELAAGCGFGRVLLSRVTDGRWLPWMVNEAIVGEAWFAEWSDRAIRLDDMLVESRLLGTDRPALVADTAADDVHPIIRAGGSTSYVVAPITLAGHVVGFFHADRPEGGRRCDESDRDLLWSFAQGFARLYDRTALAERLRSHRVEVTGLLESAASAIEDVADAEVVLAVDPDDAEPGTQAPVSSPRTGGRLGRLTPREHEVLDLIVAGARNSDIARRLVISEGTVKSHVKHVLAKLGAVNRAQAIAYTLGVRADGTDPRDAGVDGVRRRRIIPSRPGITGSGDDTRGGAA